MSEQFVCPVCGENIPFVWFDPESGYWCNTDTGDVCIIFQGCLWSIASGGNIFEENELEKVHGHE